MPDKSFADIVRSLDVMSQEPYLLRVGNAKNPKQYARHKTALGAFMTIMFFGVVGGLLYYLSTKVGADFYSIRTTYERKISAANGTELSFQENKFIPLLSVYS